MLSQVPELLQLPGFPVIPQRSPAPALAPSLLSLPPTCDVFSPFQLTRERLCRAVCKANTAAFEFYSSPPSVFTPLSELKPVPVPGPFISIKTSRAPSTDPSGTTNNAGHLPHPFAPRLLLPSAPLVPIFLTSSLSLPIPDPGSTQLMVRARICHRELFKGFLNIEINGCGGGRVVPALGV